MFVRSIITQIVYLTVVDFAQGTEREMITQKLVDANSGVCIHEGFVRPGSIKLLTYSVGKCTTNATVQYVVQFECDIYVLHEGMNIECVATSVIATAGIIGDVYLPLDETNGERISFVRVYLHRDTHLDMLDQLEEVNEQNILTVKVIGTRFQFKSKMVEATCQLVSRKTANA